MTAEPPSRPPSDPRRVRLLLLWYPAAWRARYGDEFAELLAAELAERPRSARRTANMAPEGRGGAWTDERGTSPGGLGGAKPSRPLAPWRIVANTAVTGLRARLASAGLASHPLDEAAAARASRATLACALAVFGTFSGAMWSQLAVGAQWATPHNGAITQALDLMSGALAAFAGASLLAVIVVTWTTLWMCAHGKGRPLAWPAGLVVIGATILIAGGRHFENGWPGTGGHLLLHQVGVPGGVAAFGWATTLWISSYWAHPAMLAAFGAAEVAWMVVCPAAVCCLITGAMTLLRRLEPSARALCYEIWLTRIAAASMVAFLGGALSWLASAAGRSGSLFHVGLIDDGGAAVLALAGVVAAVAIPRTRALAG